MTNMIKQDLEELARTGTPDLLAGNPSFTICRSRFAYRIKGEVCGNVCVDNDIRIQEMLQNLDINGYIALQNATTEKWNPKTMAYERTAKSVINGPEMLGLQIGRIDVIYPHQYTADKLQANIAKETTEGYRIDFPLIGIYQHVKGAMKILKGDESESKEDKFRRAVTSSVG